MTRNRSRYSPGRGAGVALLGLVLLSCTTCTRCAAVRHGHTVAGARAPNHATDFDFRSPPCSPGSKPAAQEDTLLVRYLGVSGLFLEWRGASILTAPFFSNYGTLRAGFRDVGWDAAAIDAGLAGLDLEHTGAILIGHSHYDHVGDVPPIALDHAPGARIYTNRSGANMLAAFETLPPRITVLEDLEQRWTRLRDAAGNALPARILPVISEHADHYHGYHFGDGEVEERWDSWEGRSLKAMKEGLPFAFLIDLLEADGESVAFRIYFQDSVTPPLLGLPPTAEVARREVDLAVLCMTPWWEVDGQPRAILERTRPRHVMATHFEDFLRPPDEPLRFVATLTDERADVFLATIDAVLSDEAAPPRGPDPCGCGPCGPRWSMPLPGEWLRFRTTD